MLKRKIGTCFLLHARLPSSVKPSRNSLVTLNSGFCLPGTLLPSCFLGGHDCEVNMRQSEGMMGKQTSESGGLKRSSKESGVALGTVQSPFPPCLLHSWEAWKRPSLPPPWARATTGPTAIRFYACCEDWSLLGSRPASLTLRDTGYQQNKGPENSSCPGPSSVQCCSPPRRCKGSALPSHAPYYGFKNEGAR